MTGYSYGRYISDTDVIYVNWFADHYGSDCLNIDFWSAGGKWKSVWDIDKVLDFIRTFENGLSTGGLPDKVSLKTATNEITVSGLNTDTPELYLSDIYEARVSGIQDIASFLLGLAIDARIVLVGARSEAVYKAQCTTRR